MRILVVSPQPFFSWRGTPLSVYFRTLATIQSGFDVDLLTYGQGQDLEIPRLRIYRIPAFKFLGDVKTGPSLLKLFLDIFLIIWAVVLMIRNRYGIVHAHEEAVFFCRYLKSIFGFKLIYDMHSSLPLQLKSFNFTKSRLLFALFRKLEEACLKNADAVITVCAELARYAAPLMPHPDRHFLIENSLFGHISVKNGNGTPEDRESEAATPELPGDRPVVVYAGTFEYYQGLDILIRAFSMVIDKVPDALLLLLGGRPEQIDYFRNLADSKGLDRNCIIAPRVDQEVVRRFIKRASVLVSPRKTGNNVPLKIYEHLTSGVPLVVTRVRPHTQVLDDSVCFLVDPNPDSMAQGILTALSDAEKRAQVVSNARRLYNERYSPEVYYGKMRKLFEALC